MSEPNYHAIALNSARVIEQYSDVLEKRNKELAELRVLHKRLCPSCLESIFETRKKRIEDSNS